MEFYFIFFLSYQQQVQLLLVEYLMSFISRALMLCTMAMIQCF